MTIYDKKKTKENMSLWNSVNRTDPAHTKAVGFGRGFTAIDAHYQIMRATETFGSVGTGWGYDVVYKIELYGKELEVILSALYVLLRHFIIKKIN